MNAERVLATHVCDTEEAAPRVNIVLGLEDTSQLLYSLSYRCDTEDYDRPGSAEAKVVSALLRVIKRQLIRTLPDELLDEVFGLKD
jgi:hypothetical protein